MLFLLGFPAACISTARDMLRLGLFIYQKPMVHLIS